MSLSAIRMTALSLCLLAPIGCAATSSSKEADTKTPQSGDAADGADVGVAEDELSASKPAPKTPTTPTTPKPKTCGGFAGIACDPGEECVDDPSDDCDPVNNNYDCGGICKLKTPVRRF